MGAQRTMFDELSGFENKLKLGENLSEDLESTVTISSILEDSTNIHITLININ